MRNVVFVRAGLVLSALLSVVPAARAADHEFCRKYADSAIRQFEEATKFGRCMRHVDRDRNRWSDRFEGHYNWCRNVDYRQADRERNERAHILRECR